MLQLHRNHDNTWAVLQDGAVVFTGTMLAARALYAKLMTERLHTTSRKNANRRIFSR